MRGHRLNRSNLYLLRSANYVEAMAAPALGKLAPSLQSEHAAGVVRNALEEIIRWKNVVRCREDHAGGGGYFTAAEQVMAWQWENVIFPIIGQCDFTTTLELGCGHGRNVELLRKLAKTVILVDVNDLCLAACRERFGATRDGCDFRYHQTIGNRLDGIADGSVTLVYSWDTMVHFDKLVVRDYVGEFARVLRPGGHAFLHYSNQGAENPNSDCGDNHGHRGDMTPELFASYARDNGLTIAYHRLSGDDLRGVRLMFGTGLLGPFGSRVHRKIHAIQYALRPKQGIEAFPKRLHLGCGIMRAPGFCNVDVTPQPSVDVIDDIAVLRRFPDNYAELIYACHVLEHFSHAELIEVLKTWFRVPGTGRRDTHLGARHRPDRE